MEPQRPARDLEIDGGVGFERVLPIHLEPEVVTVELLRFFDRKDTQEGDSMQEPDC